jgi:hypothetical protein
LARQLIAHTSFKPNYVKDYIIKESLGITDATDDEIAYLENWQEKNLTSSNIEEHLANMVSVRALIGVSHCPCRHCPSNFYSFRSSGPPTVTPLLT